MRPRRHLQTWILLFCVAAFGVRSAWVPAHLAHATHQQTGTPHGDHGHEHPGDPGQDQHHEPHPAAEHELVLVSPRPGFEFMQAWAAPPEAPSGWLPLSGLVQSVEEPRVPVPRSWPAGPQRPRAPPC